ncbi:glycoside hydrolase family 3 N-terminal domain-containing protein [Sulfodiicoccus acidiphilus]|uniref:glycoside hydrolase family 3 N-terminal domain-containing protein n=1 Tax=Sulfodiicoccus acidiphilus TaxID=1670455 RepID=UPI001E35188F|nr:glycoside hydrolase family 3 N-terminal domain-containing protein [Sulfodiicoccus acidiphilus]
MSSDRVDRLLRSMSLEEKVAQLQGISIYKLVEDGQFSTSNADKFIANGIGHISRVGGTRLGLRPKDVAKLVNQIQKYLVERGKVPAIVHEEALSGLMAPTATIFPQAIGLASSFDVELLEEIGSTIGRQTRSVGAVQALSPVLDVVWDPRWGRVEETYGEDPYLVASLGVSYIKGLQRERVVATAKHFAAHGVPEGGRNTAQVHVGERDLREVFLLPFEAAVKVAKVKSIMAAYHDLNGVPCHVDKWLLTEILRKEWGFDGNVVSDYDAIRMLIDVHRIAEDELDAAVQALEAGVTIELPDSPACFSRIVDAVKAGKLSEAVVDERVREVLRVKEWTGVLDNPFVNESEVPEKLDSKAARELSLRAARESIVLLKNNGVLPLSKTLSSVSIIGPNAFSGRSLMGDYHYPSHVGIEAGEPETISILQGIKEKVPVVHFAAGCEVSGSSTEGFREAVEVAERGQVIVAVVGERSGGFWLNDPRLSSGEGVDRASLDLPGAQSGLLRELLRLGKPLVLVLVNGRPLAIGEFVERVDAVLEAWYPGEEGGRAVADVLFGDYNPSGRLPISIPRAVGSIPNYYYRHPSSYKRYVELDSEPLFPFGHGLSYTSFRYSSLKVEPKSVEPGGYVKVSVQVENVGTRFGTEVVQLYVSKKKASVSRPVRQLKGFKRVSLDPQERAIVHFKVPLSALGFLDRDMRWVLESGEYVVEVGSSSSEIKVLDSFEVVREKAVIRNEFFSEIC